MKKHLSLVIILGMVLALASRPVSAEDKTKDDLVIKAKAVAGAEGVSETARSSKFYEYRDVPNSFIFRAFDLSLTKGNRYLTLTADRIRQRDARYTIALGEYGKYKVDFMWDKTPHRFSFFAKTLYVPSPIPAPGPGIFSGPGIYDYGIADPIQSILEAAPTYNDAKALLSPFLTGVHDIDLGLQRNKGTLNLAYTPSVPLSLTINASRETRKGNRAIGASFGLSNAVEMPEPINFVTTDLDAKVEYSKKWGTVQAGYDVSAFDNEYQAMIWDNPYRLTDRNYDGAYRNGDATSRGQMALAPSNTAQKFFLSGVLKILKHTKLSGNLSYGIFSQNERLLPYTINSALAVPDPLNPALPYFAGALTPPRETAQAKADITSIDLSLNSRLVKSVYLNAGYRYYNFGNKTAVLETPGFAVMDEVWTPEAQTIEPYSFTRAKAFADVSWHFMRSTSLKIGYAYSTIERREGAEVEGPGEDKSHENTIKADLDSNPLDWLLVRVSYLSGRRKWSLDGADVIYDPTFNFKRYYEANRNRDAVDLLVGFSLINNLDLELSYMLGNDTYPTSDYGLKKSDFTSYAADLTYTFGKAASAYGFYSNERYKALQASRQSGATFSIDPADDWTALLKDTVNTIGGGLNTVLVKNKLNLDISYSYSYIKGTSSLASPPGGTLDVAVNFTRGLDTTKLQVAKAQLFWKLRSNLSVVFGYWYEQYNLDDITRNDYRVDYVITGSGMYLGALEPGYKYHVGSVRFIYSW